MKITTLSTGSSGNCYIISDNGEDLILDLGINRKKILSSLNNELVGVLLSHRHADHLWKDNDIYFSEYTKVLSPQNTIVGKEYKLGHYTITPLQADHDVECYSFLIQTPTDTILFATDTHTIPKVSQIVDIFLIEINYCERKVFGILNNINEATSDWFYYHRVLKTHASLESVAKYIDELPYRPQTIMAIHLSHTQANIDHKLITDSIEPLCDELIFADETKEYDFRKRI